MRSLHGRFHPARPRSLLVLAGLFVMGFTLGGRPLPSVDAQINGIVGHADVRSAFWGIYVQDLGSGQVIYQQNADKTLMPASNQKLFTTATALDALGADYRYQTTLYFNGQVNGDALRGDLILEGSGDPTFGSRELGMPDALRGWARELARMGVKRIEGRIIGDDDVFDDEAYAEGWDVEYIAKESFAPAKGGLSYHDNTSELHLAAGAGGALSVEQLPSAYVKVRNRTGTAGKGQGGYPRLQRQVGTDAVTLYGTASRSYQGGIAFPIANPTAFTLHAFHHFLREAGIQVDAKVYDIDDLDEAPDRDGAEPLLVYASPPLSEIIAIINKESHNFYAEQVFSTFGWGGSAEGASRRVMGLLSRMGVSTAGLSIMDGSGLSRKDMITPEAMGKLLAGMYRHEEREAFLASLAAGGEPRTTLQGRLHGLPVRAKTGSIEYSRALSGYVTTPEGRPLAFVVIANNYTVPDARIIQAIDQVVQVLAGHGAAPVATGG